MSVQRLNANDFTILENPGVLSQQMVWPKNSPDALISVTRVTMEPGGTTPRHSHPNSGQIWIVESGEATLLLADGKTSKLQVGDVARTPAGQIHGIINTGAEALVYITATTPPLDLTTLYRGKVDKE